MTDALLVKNKDQEPERSPLLDYIFQKPINTTYASFYSNTKRLRVNSRFKILRLNPTKPIEFKQISKRRFEIINNLKDSSNECITLAVPKAI
jgi:hypothetical protein